MPYPVTPDGAFAVTSAEHAGLPPPPPGRNWVRLESARTGQVEARPVIVSDDAAAYWRAVYELAETAITWAAEMDARGVSAAEADVLLYLADLVNERVPDEEAAERLYPWVAADVLPPSTEGLDESIVWYAEHLVPRTRWAMLRDVLNEIKARTAS